MLCAKAVTLHRAMSHVALHLTTPSTGTPSSHVLHPPLSGHKPCGDLRPQLSGVLVEARPFTQADSLPTDARELFHGCGFVGCHSIRSDDL